MSSCRGPPLPVDGERARLFVALDVPPGAREALERWRSRALREVRGLRLIAPEALHATLCFLGWRSVDEVEQIGAACEAAVSGFDKPALRFGDPVWLPKRRPRVLGVRLDDPSGVLARIQAALSDALVAGGWYSPEKRPFVAHVTVARAAGGAHLRAVELPSVDSAGFDEAAVTLYRSRLERAGARYEALHRVPFV
jgi:2'-5' RNA ligase